MSESNEKHQLDLVSDTNELKNKIKDTLVGYISHLRGKIDELESYKLLSNRIEQLERSHFRYLQYGRRESIEISGIPADVDDKGLEDKTLQVLNEIGVDKVEKWQIHACHRLKNKKNTVIRFVTRKFSDSALHNKGKLKTLDKTKLGFPAKTQIYINESLCRPVSYLYYLVRQAAKEKKLLITICGKAESL